MANYIRQGTCNWCGQCCGAPYFSNPDPRTPWPSDWPWVLDWDNDSLDADCPFGAIVINSLNTSGVWAALIGGNQFRIIIVEDVGIVKDEPTYGDTSTYTNQCPFLLLHGEGETPPTECGADNLSIFTGYCSTKPKELMTEEEMLQWTASFPACSYTWIEE